MLPLCYTACMIAELARTVDDRIAAGIRDGRVPQVVLDLDGTLFDNVPRSKVILLDAAEARFGAGGPVATAIAAIDEAAFEYNPIDTLRKHGVQDQATLDVLHEEWAQRFFGSRYLGHDVPLGGAVQAARRWWDAGAELNYLTGRHVPEMFLGTCESLHDAGFPVGTIRTQMIMKPRFDANDVAFKIETVPSIRRKGPIVLMVDNDPRVLNALVVAVPEALAVMVKTLYPHDAPDPVAEIRRVDDFRALLGAAPPEGL